MEVTIDYWRLLGITRDIERLLLLGDNRACTTERLSKKGSWTMHSVATWFTACGTNQNMASNTRPLESCIMHNSSTGTSAKYNEM